MTTPQPSVDRSAENRRILADMRPALVKYFTRKTGSLAEAEDLAQDVIARALANARWTCYEQAKGYVFRSAVNRWHDHCRIKRTHGQVLPWDDGVARNTGVENPPERVLMVEEDLAAVSRVLSALNERTRTVLILVRVERMKVANVAAMLGISVSAVNKHLAKGLARLMALRREQGGS